MNTIAKLTVDLLAETSKFRSDLEKANKDTKSWSAGVKASAGAAATAMVAMGTAAATALVGVYTVTAQNIDEQAKFADRIGITTDALAALQYAGELTGVTSDRMADSLQGMVERVSEATTGTGEAAEALQNLGLSAEELNKLSPDQQFLEIAKAMEQVESRSDQVRMAIQIFEGEGAALLNTLDAGVDGIHGMMTEAEALGITLSRIDAAQVEQANDAFYRVTQAGSGFAKSLTVELAPIVQGVSTSLVNAAVEAGGFTQVTEVMVETIVSGVGMIADRIYWITIPLSAVKAGFLELAAVAAEAMSGSAETITEVLNATLGEWGKGINWLIQELAKLAELGANLPGNIGQMSQEISDTLAGFGDGIQESLTFDTSDVLDGIATIRISANEAHQDFIDLANQPLPSEQIKLHVAEWRKLSEEQAKAAANSKLYNAGAGGNGEETGTGTTFTDTEKDRMETELAKLQESFLTEMQLIDLQEQQKLDKLKLWRDADIEGMENYESLKTQVQKQAEAERNKLTTANNQAMLGNSANLFGSMADLAGAFAGEQSGIYKGIFAVSKAFSIAESIMAIQTGIAKAASLPFPSNIPAMAAVAAQTASIVTTIQGTQFNGMAHDGIDYIPKEGTWLLDKGERVVDSRTNEDLKNYLSGKNQAANNGSGGVVVNIIDQAGVNTEVDESEDEFGRKVINVLLMDQRDGGEVTSGYQTMWNLSRKGQF